MKNTTEPYERLFQLSSRLTDRAPVLGSQLLDATLRLAIGGQLPWRLAHSREVLRRAPAFHRFLVIADLNIGDAVLLQAVVRGVRDFFPDARIDYLVARSARSVLEGAPEIATLLPELTGSPLPNPADRERVRRLTERGGYDVVLNFCPFFDRSLLPRGTAGEEWAALAALLVRDVMRGEGTVHVAAQAHRLVRLLFADFATPRRTPHFTGVPVTLSDAAIETAQEWTARHLPAAPVVLYNPDASSRFTRLPFDTQVALLRRLVALPATLVLGAGHAEIGLETRLLAELSPGERNAIVVLPASTPLDVYTAVIDAADVYVTGDTGPLHLAAARKRSRSGRSTLRNRTAVHAVFGATPPGLYGYDSARPGFLAADQDASSYTHVARSPCRNITCINKMAKTCASVRCFEQLDVDRIARAVAAGLDHAARSVA